jgi:hypothetical protein
VFFREKPRNSSLDVPKRPVETIPGMKGEKMRENDGGGEISYDILKELL